MRTIYSDEAGISEREPVSIVFGMLVHPDTQWWPLVSEMRQLFQNVPDKFKDGFAFHGKDLSAGNKYPGWDVAERHQLMLSAMRIPKRFGVPISFAAVRRGTSGQDPKYRPEDLDHLRAFGMCMSQFHQYMEKHCQGELAALVAEKTQRMERLLTKAADFFRIKPHGYLVKEKLPDGSTAWRERITQIDTIIDEAHFSSPHASPLLQIADLCAFGIRAFYSEDRSKPRFGFIREYMEAIWPGTPPVFEDGIAPAWLWYPAVSPDGHAWQPWAPR